MGLYLIVNHEIVKRKSGTASQQFKQQRLVLLRLQDSKIAHVSNYLRVPQAAGQEKSLVFLLKIIFPIYANSVLMKRMCVF